MWNKIFKNKSSKSIGKRDNKDDTSTRSPKSKLSKVVHSFTLKRSPKDNCNTEKTTAESSINKFTNTSEISETPTRSGPISTKSDYPTIETVGEPDNIELELQPCSICTRTFIPETLAKHVKICEKMAMKKRKIFDSSRQRWGGTDLVDFLPTNYNTTPVKTEPKTSSKVTPSVPTVSPKRQDDTPKPQPNQPKKVISPAAVQSVPSKEKPKATTKRNLQPPTEQCPHCERCFGLKAYERHVEWCKEKSRIASMHNNSSLLAAKERLQARTKYKAPCLKTKRAANREKYSGLNCGDSTNSLSDGGGNGSSKKPNTDDQKMIMSTSLSSSIMSDGGLSDKYDPFLSAKRQLEELCSPTSPTVPLISPTTPDAKSKVKTTLSSSYTSSSNPRTTLNNVKSNFRRTSSLRVPRKPSSRPIFIPPALQKPTIQRGISDEGPISSNFLKPEEYDEMPVKSVCVNDFAITHSPKIIKRDSSSAINRKNLRLNLGKSTHNANNQGIPLSKTDSLAVFLKYENEAKNSKNPVDLTEKDLKDKSNTLSKQTSQKNPSSSKTDKDLNSSLKETITNIIEPKNTFMENTKNLDQNIKNINTTKIYPIKLEPLPKPISPKPLSKLPSISLPTTNINLSSILDSKDNDYIDPKLINVCDNLPVPVNVAKLSDSDLTSSSTDSNCTAKHIVGSQTQMQRQSQFQQQNQSCSNRNSTEKRNLLKRQIRLGKNQFLYDISPDSDPYSEECDKTISIIDPDPKRFNPSVDEPSFDDFDFEEFISSFEHDEDQFPIFRDCKEFLLNRSFNRRCNNLNDHSIRSPTNMTLDFENQGEKGEIFISIESNQSGSTPSPIDPPTHIESEEHNRNNNETEKLYDERSLNHDEKQDLFEDIPDVNKNNAKNIMKKIENEFTEKDQCIPQACDTGTTMYPLDSDEISSVECYPIRRTPKSKQSADSAYGSLSRHSPTELRPIRRNTIRNRQQSAPPNSEQQFSFKYQNDSGKQHNRNFSASSSGSDTSLPPIQGQREIEKPYQDMKKEKDQHSNKEMRMSKFCHECGSKFVIAYAKFCMECGVKRIVLE